VLTFMQVSAAIAAFPPVAAPRDADVDGVGAVALLQALTSTIANMAIEVSPTIRRG
jgi:hypothetical protein